MQSISLPKPNNPEIFESLCLDLFKNYLPCKNLRKHGRKGQKQYGIDIYGNEGSKSYAIQCKQTNKEITEEIINDELRKLSDYNTGIDKYIIATTASRDAKTQRIERKINSSKEFEFEFQIYYWEDLEDEISKNLILLLTRYLNFSIKQHT